MLKYYAIIVRYRKNKGNLPLVLILGVANSIGTQQVIVEYLDKSVDLLPY